MDVVSFHTRRTTVVARHPAGPGHFIKLHEGTLAMTTAFPIRVAPTRRKVLAAAAVFSMAGAVSAMTTAPAKAATPDCGEQCISVFSSRLGTFADPNFIEAVLERGAAEVGQPVGLKPASGTDPSQDFMPGGATEEGLATVSDFYADGLVSARANRRYGDLPAVQQRYAPLGDDTGLCVGVARVKQGEDLTLQSCDDPTTVWIIYPSAGAEDNYFAVVNAATTKFNRPFAMHLPRKEIKQIACGDSELQMQLRRLQYRTSDKALPARQVWGAVFGPQTSQDAR